MHCLVVPAASTVIMQPRLVVLHFPASRQGYDLQLQPLVSMWVDDPVIFLLCPEIIRVMLGMLLQLNFTVLLLKYFPNAEPLGKCLSIMARYFLAKLVLTSSFHGGQNQITFLLRDLFLATVFPVYWSSSLYPEAFMALMYIYVQTDNQMDR